MTSRFDVISLLTRLIDCCREGEALCRTGAEQIEDAIYNALFIHQWQQYAQWVAELQTKVRWYGGELRHFSTPNLQRESYNYSYCQSSMKENLILNERILWETETLQLYSDILKCILPLDVRMLLERQQMAKKEMLDRLVSVCRREIAV